MSWSQKSDSGWGRLGMKSDFNQVRKIPVGAVCASISDTFRGNVQQVVLVNTSDVLEGKVLNHQPVPNKNLRGQFKKTFCKEDILYSEIRPQNNRFAFVDFSPCNYIASTKLMVLRADRQQILPRYLYYFLTSNLIIAELQMLAETRSGTFPQITFSELANITIPVPLLDVQQSIVDIVKCIDDKIELNQKINENLERQAQALYIAMFVDNLELSTTPGILSDIATITMGQSPTGSSYNEEGIGEVFYQGRAEFGFRFPTRRLYTTEPKRFAEAGDVLLSVRAPVGDLNVAFERCCIGRGLGAVHSKSDNSSFILYTMRALKPQLDVFNGEGTVFGSINRDALNSIPLNIPSPEAITHFESIVQPIDELIRGNCEEIYYLQTLRDTLLPKLMAGEIDVRSINI